VAVIVDTDVVSFLLKKDSRAALYRPHLEGLPKIISFMTLAELRRWEFQNNWGARRIKAAREFFDDFPSFIRTKSFAKSERKSSATHTNTAIR
jgi:predicted nucleic acid-binding protein